ncbi:RPII140-upstream gene protein [Ostrinia nubilalis]|uniref:RPII140-upstream gene protein n=1 Tax=Ostrinia furnacalis TaxID=93504 RepID=UPI001039B403|nr:RPII140-upstream gene protein [Ostrinia furnacalis]
MLRTVVRLTPTFIFPIFESRNANDYDMLNKDTEAPRTGFERVKMMYTTNEYDEVSPEMNQVAQAAMFGTFIGGCMGGFVKSRNAYLYFIETNQATIFTSTMQAKKKLQDYVTVAFAKGACQWGWRLGIFSGMFSLIATTISVYRDDTSLVEYITAGAITGGLYKANLGLAATFVGAGLGAALSTIAGLAILGVLKITGVSMEDIRQALYKLREVREDQLNQAIEKSAKIKNDDLTRHHDQLVLEKGEKKVEEM